MARYLTALASISRKAGLQTVEIDGWRTRTRPQTSSQHFNPRGVMCHHTGGAGDSLAYIRWMAITGRSDLAAPLAQLGLGRKGIVYVMAAGRANHGGSARAFGSVPGGDGNELYVGIEAMNTGSEGWGPLQYNAYVRLVAALNVHYGWPSTATAGHKETSYSGKPDPGQMDMAKFRKHVAADMALLKSCWDRGIVGAAIPPVGSPIPGQYPIPGSHSTRRLEVDGSFGPKTVTALQDYIRRAYKSGIKVDGSWGPASRRFLEYVLNYEARNRGWKIEPVKGTTAPGVTSLHTWRLRWLVGRNPVEGAWDTETTRQLQRFLNKKNGF